MSALVGEYREYDPTIYLNNHLSKHLPVHTAMSLVTVSDLFAKGIADLSMTLPVKSCCHTVFVSCIVRWKSIDRCSDITLQLKDAGAGQ
jgi:hypothetical protein